MDKIDLNSRDILGGNVEKIAELFPGVVTEAKDEATGELKKVVDFDLLRQHLSDELVEGDRERFRLDWPGKKASILKANTPIHKTLRPVREDSEDFDTTENVFIEGDNFEVLKVLQESYLGRVKMIYIDPPYNTGKDFIFKDDFAVDKDEFEEEIGVRDDENGGKLVKNTETNGRYHSDWLSMMQERLIVARDLLTDDGMIFISIGEDEIDHLRILCSEAFDENNVEVMIWNKVSESGSAGQGKMKITHRFRKDHEYLLVVYKDKESTLFNKPLKVKQFKNTYGNTDSDPRGDWVSSEICKSEEKSNPAGKNYYEITTSAGLKISRQWHVDKKTFDKLDADGRIYWGSGKTVPRLKRFVNEPQPTTPTSVISGISQTDGNGDLGSVLENTLFDNPKPVSLISWLVEIACSIDATVLDFFSGSGTTAHAVMQLNAEDGGNRKHIQVQLAEPTDESSEAYKAGYKSIPEISRERIRRAGKKIREDYAEQIAKRKENGGTPLDTGFRAFKLSSSNFKDTAKHPDQIDQTSLLADTNSIKTDRTADDLLTEVILSLGLTLDLPIETRGIAGHTVYFVGGNSLVACFDDTVSLDIVDDIAAEKPLRVVFKDSSFASDETRINIDIRIKQLSPDTTVQVV